MLGFESKFGVVFGATLGNRMGFWLPVDTMVGLPTVVGDAVGVVVDLKMPLGEKLSTGLSLDVTLLVLTDGVVLGLDDGLSCCLSVGTDEDIPIG